eukprot:2343206-Rhodomonas_salina.2
MSGTDVGYAATRRYNCLGCDPGDRRRVPNPLIPLGVCYAMSGITQVGAYSAVFGAAVCYAFCMRWVVLTLGMLLRHCYAMSGTDC